MSPFGRQPKPITITLVGEREDIEYWGRELMRRAEFKGDSVERQKYLEDLNEVIFKIYPRAIND